MSKVTRVTVLCPNGRRQTVNLAPNSSILQILEEVCQKQNLNPDDFDICHYNKPVDLTLPVRFANLSNNAQLELQPVKVARKDCLVTVGLQLEAGERIMKDFVPSTTIWDVVEQCMSTKHEKVNLDENVEPVCVYMRQKIVGDALKETTLRSLGLTKGSAVIRLLYRNPKDMSDQAHVSASLCKPPKVSSPIHSTTIPSPMECDSTDNKSKIYSEKDNIKKNTNVIPVTPDEHKDVGNNIKNLNVTTNEENLLEHNLNKDVKDMGAKAVTNILNKTNEEISCLPQEQKMELDSSIMEQESSIKVEEIGAIHYIGSRHAVLYSLDDITDTKKADLPDEFFQLTVDDARYLMEQFKKARVDMENQPLLTKELRHRQIVQKLGRFKKAVIRIYFPERLVLQAVFEAEETVKDVCDFIRNYLEDRNINFYLYTAPPKEIKDPVKTLIESMLIPAAVVYFGCDKHNPNYLMNTLREKVSDPRAAALAAHESRQQAIREVEEISYEQLVEIAPTAVEADVSDYKPPDQSFAQPSSSIQITGNVPKWLKLSKK